MYLTRTNDSQFIMIFFEIIIAVNDKMPDGLVRISPISLCLMYKRISQVCIPFKWTSISYLFNENM